MSQLSLIYEHVQPLLQMDIVSALPPELSIKTLHYLDAQSLCRAARVCKAWRKLADDDAVWHRMCEQHIGKTCAKCGWGLPLLYRRRKRCCVSLENMDARDQGVHCKQHDVTNANNQGNSVLPIGQQQVTLSILPLSPSSTSVSLICQGQSSAVSTHSSPAYTDMSPDLSFASNPLNENISNMNTTCSKKRRESHLTSNSLSLPLLPIEDQPLLPSIAKRSKVSVNLSETDVDCHTQTSSICLAPTNKRSWKSIYAERLIVERNWRQNIYIRYAIVPSIIDTSYALPSTEFSFTVTSAHHDDNILMTACSDHQIRFWSLNAKNVTGALPTSPASTVSAAKALLCTLVGHTAPVMAAYFDDTKCVSGSADTTVRIWNYHRGTCLRTLRGHRSAVMCIAVEECLIVSGDASGVCRVWDFESKSCFGFLHYEPTNAAITAFGLGHESTAPANTSQQPLHINHSQQPIAQSLHSYGQESAAYFSPIPNVITSIPPSGVTCVKLMKNRKLLYTAGEDGIVRLWNFQTRTCIQSFSPISTLHPSPISTTIQNTALRYPHPAINSMSCSPVHTTLAKRIMRSTISTSAISCTRGDPNTLPQPVLFSFDAIIKLHIALASSLTFLTSSSTIITTAEDPLVITGCADGHIRIYYALCGSDPVATLRHLTRNAASQFNLNGIPSLSDLGTGSNIFSSTLAFSYPDTPALAITSVWSDSLRLVSVDATGFINVWDLTTGRLLLYLDSYSPECNEPIHGQYVVTGGETRLICTGPQGTIHVWEYGIGM